MMYNNIRDGSIVTIGDLNLIVRIKNINNQIYYSLYYGDGTLYKSDLNSLNDIGVTKLMVYLWLLAVTMIVFHQLRVVGVIT